MSKKRVIQTGGSTEAREASGSSSGSGREPHYRYQWLKPGDAEYDFYNELFHGFLSKLTRWRMILLADEYRRLNPPPISRIVIDSTYYEFNMLQTPQGLEIGPPDDVVTPNRVLRIIGEVSFNDTEVNAIRFLITPGPAGQHIFTDPVDGKPLEVIEIEVGETFSAETRWNGVVMRTKRYTDKPGGDYSSRQVEYSNPIRNSLRVIHGYPHSLAMNDEMVTNLINTIDALIPGSTSSIQKPERRASQKTPKSLPPARRKRSL